MTRRRNDKRARSGRHEGTGALSYLGSAAGICAVTLLGLAVGIGGVTLAAWHSSGTMAGGTITSGNLSLTPLCGDTTTGNDSCLSAQMVITPSPSPATASATPTTVASASPVAHPTASIDPVCGPGTEQIYSEQLNIALTNGEDPQISNMEANLAVFLPDKASGISVGADVTSATVELDDPSGNVVAPVVTPSTGTNPLISGMKTESAAGYSAGANVPSSYPLNWKINTADTGTYTVKWIFTVSCDTWNPASAQALVPARQWALEQER
jgi:hypothetical protein